MATTQPDPWMVAVDLVQSESEHCRHHFFRGIPVTSDGSHQPSLFTLIKRTLTGHTDPSHSLVAFCDNSSVIEGGLTSSLYIDRDIPSRLSYFNTGHSSLCFNGGNT